MTTASGADEKNVTDMLLTAQDAIPIPADGATKAQYEADVLSKYVNEDGTPCTFSDLLLVPKLVSTLLANSTFVEMKTSFERALSLPPETNEEKVADGNGSEAGAVSVDRGEPVPKITNVALGVGSDLETGHESQKPPASEPPPAAKESLLDVAYSTMAFEFIGSPKVELDGDFYRITSTGLEDLDKCGFARIDDKSNFLADLVVAVMVQCRPGLKIVVSERGLTTQPGYGYDLSQNDHERYVLNQGVFENVTPGVGPFTVTMRNIVRNFGPPVVMGGMPLAPVFQTYVLSYTHQATGPVHRMINVSGRSEYLANLLLLAESRMNTRLRTDGINIDSIMYPLQGYLERIYNPRAISHIYALAGQTDAYSGSSLKAYSFVKVTLDVTNNIFSGFMDMVVDDELGPDLRDRSFNLAKDFMMANLQESLDDVSTAMRGDDQILATVISPSAALVGIATLAAWCAGGSNMVLSINVDDPLLTQTENVLAPTAAFAFLLMVPAGSMDPVAYRKLIALMLRAAMTDDDASRLTYDLMGSGYLARQHADAAQTRVNHNAVFAASAPAYGINPVGRQIVPGAYNLILGFLNATCGRRLARLPLNARLFAAQIGGAGIRNELALNAPGALDHSVFLPFNVDVGLAPFTPDIVASRLSAGANNIAIINSRNHATRDMRNIRRLIGSFWDFSVAMLSARTANVHRTRKADLSGFLAKYMRAASINAIHSAGVVNYATASAGDVTGTVPPLDPRLYRVAARNTRGLSHGKHVELSVAFALSFAMLGVNVSGITESRKPLTLAKPSLDPLYYKYENWAAVYVLGTACADPIGIKVFAKNAHLHGAQLKDCHLMKAMIEVLGRFMAPRPGHMHRLGYYRRTFMDNLVSLDVPAAGAVRALAENSIMIALTVAEKISLSAGGANTVIRPPPVYYRGMENRAVITFIDPVRPYALSPAYEAFGNDNLTDVYVFGLDPAREPAYLSDADVETIHLYVKSLSDLYSLRTNRFGLLVAPGAPMDGSDAEWDADAARLALRPLIADPNGYVIPFTALRLARDYLAPTGNAMPTAAYGMSVFKTERDIVDAAKTLMLTWINIISEAGRLNDAQGFPAFDTVSAVRRINNLVGVSLNHKPGVDACFVKVNLTRVTPDEHMVSKLVPPTIEMKEHSGVLESIVSAVPLYYYSIGKASPQPRYLNVHTIPVSQHLERVKVDRQPGGGPPYDYPRMGGYLLGSTVAGNFVQANEIVEVYKRENETVLDGAVLFEKSIGLVKLTDGVK